MPNTVMDTINASYDRFFDSEKKIAKYIIEHYDEVVEMTVSELAKASSASEASVSRFCRRIGMKGFHQLKISLAKEMAESSRNPVRIAHEISEDTISQSLQNILANKMDELTRTVSMIDEKELHEVLERLKNARSIVFTAAGNTIPVAMDGAFKFTLLGKRAYASPIWEMQIGSIGTLGPEDVVIAISNSGESRSVVQSVEAACQQGVPVLAITNDKNSTVAKAATYHLITATRERVFLNGYCFSRVSAAFMIEILYLFLASMIPDAFQNIAMHESRIAEDKF